MSKRDFEFFANALYTHAKPHMSVNEYRAMVEEYAEYFADHYPLFNPDLWIAKCMVGKGR